MKIDKDKLISLLVDKTSMDREEIETQLDQLIERILDAAKRGKALEIKEFGLFFFDETGELKFEAAKELSTEISFKYAGMKPVELKPERDTSIPGLEEEDEDREEDETEEEEPGDFAPFEPDEDESEPFDLSDEPEPEEEPDVLSDPFSPEALEPLEETDTSEEKKSTIEDVQPSLNKPVQKKKDKTGLFVVITIVGLVVLIGGYFYFAETWMYTQQPEPTVTTSQEAQPQSESEPEQDEGSNTEEPAAPETGSESEPAGESDSEQMSEEPIETESPAPTETENQEQQPEEPAGLGETISIEETDQSMYGLRGMVIEEANNGYSIVIHSFESENNAWTTAQQLQEDNYRVIVTSRNVAGSTVWRVSLGQFSSLEEAQSATTELPTPYNTQHFIHRIQLN